MPSPNRRNDDVARLRPFRDANKYAVNDANHRLYVVYSFGPHWPMFVFDRKTCRWYANDDTPPSQTTKRHVTQCYPHHVKADEFEYVNTQWLKRFIADVAKAETLEDVPC